MVKDYMHRANVLREAKGFGLNFVVFAGSTDQSLSALLAEANGAIRGLTNIVPEFFVRLVRAFEGDLAEAMALHRRVLTLTAICALSDPGLGAAKLVTKKPGFPVSPTCAPALLGTPDSEEAVEAGVGAPSYYQFKAKRDRLSDG